jgi:UDP-2,3-diacylglucosamine pyrophosphatase LpxH
MNDYKRLIISDLHIGSLYSKEKELLKFLKEMEYDELILAGDIIDFIKVPDFTIESSEIFKFLSSLDKKIIYVVGNHDISLEKFKDIQIGNFYFCEQYDFEYSDRKYRVIHGHQYDTGLVKKRYFMTLMSVCHDWIERVLRFNVTSAFSRFLISMKKLRNIWDVIKWNKDVDVLIMGHIHEPEVVIWVNKYGKIKTYANSGDWVDNMSYIILKEGQLRLKMWSENG